MQCSNLLKIHRFEIAGVMAAFAIAAEATVMFVIGRVATETIARQFHFVGWLAMTFIALQFFMRARDRKFSVLIVIELNAFPAPGGMARVAFIAERAFVLIVFLVTGDAARGRALERRADMAALARHHGMQPRQRELRFGMIENDFLFPSVFVMATFTALALLPLVHIVEAMTTVAGIRHFIVHIAAVA